MNTALDISFVIAVLAISFITGYAINRHYKYRPSAVRYETIDGLRGFLAISVFIHHTVIWHGSLQTGVWKAPASNLYNQLGQTGVTLFFMISSFLFISRLLNFKKKVYDWRRFFVKRLRRLLPLHLLALFMIILLVFIQGEWTLVEDLTTVFRQIAHHLAFGLLDLPEINGVDAGRVNAGVLWSLSYEWLFYLSLPVLSIFILRSKPDPIMILCCIGCIAFILQYRSFHFHHILSFVGGALAPYISKYLKRAIDFNHIAFSLLAVFSLFIIVQFHSSAHIICKMAIISAFTLIALGNNLFGLLKSTTLRFLGELSYSTYLLHGIILFCTFQYFLGAEELKTWSVLEYRGLMLLLVPIIIFVSFLSYHYVEKPFMKKSFNSAHK